MESRQIREILIKECNISGKKPLIVGVSGGADSLCMLSLLSATGIPIIAAHFNHQLRPVSGGDERVVSRFAEAMKCFFVSGSGEVRVAAKKNGLNLEAAAREARYTFLFAQARRLGAEAVAVGHTADDQIETILMHILRGSGLDGLKGMSYRSLLPSYSSEIPLIRPLLGFWRKETAQYCAENGLQPLEDETNRDKRYLRNRLRLDLIPELQTYNPQIKQRIWTLGQVAQSSLNGITEAGEWIYQRCLVTESPREYSALNKVEISKLPDSMLSQVIRTAASRAHLEPANFDYKAIQRALRFVRNPAPSGRIDLTENLILMKLNDRIYITTKDYSIPMDEWPQISEARMISIEAPGQVDLGKGWCITTELRLWNSNQPVPESSEEAWLDRNLVSTPLSVRAWRNGDRFQPFGMDGSVKISDFFVNQKIPQPTRRGWPLVTAGNDIVWVTGLRISEKYRVQVNTREVIHLVLIRIDLPHQSGN